MAIGVLYVLSVRLVAAVAAGCSVHARLKPRPRHHDASQSLAGCYTTTRIRQHAEMQDVKIGLVNMESVVGDTDANLLSMAAWAGKAAAEGVEILW